MFILISFPPRSDHRHFPVTQSTLCPSVNSLSSTNNWMNARLNFPLTFLSPGTSWHLQCQPELNILNFKARLINHRSVLFLSSSFSSCCQCHHFSKIPQSHLEMFFNFLLPLFSTSSPGQHLSAHFCYTGLLGFYSLITISLAWPRRNDILKESITILSTWKLHNFSDLTQ